MRVPKQLLTVITFHDRDSPVTSSAEKGEKHLVLHSSSFLESDVEFYQLPKRPRYPVAIFLSFRSTSMFQIGGFHPVMMAVA